MFRPDYPLRKFFTFFAFFTMMFSGGLAPTVMVSRNLLGLDNNYSALIVPILVNPFLFLVMRTFYKTSVSMSLIESALLDGSGEFNTLIRIVTPISKPGIATVGLLFALAYWNEWFLALIYIKDRSLYPLQFLLMQMQISIETFRRNIHMMGGLGGISFEDLPSEGLRMAMCAFIVMPIACAYPFFQRYIIAGLTMGALKE
jgi:putative aldouronate transport system permease protein